MTNPSPPTTSRMFLLVAVALGILATILAFVFIQSGANANSGPTVEVVVARRDISPNTPIDPERDLKLWKIPKDFEATRERTIDWAGRAAFKGQRVNRDIRANQPVLLADFSAVGDLQLSDPYFALTIPADTGMIIPGDHVKIILAKLSIPTTEPATTMPAFDAVILGPKEGFKVLAVGPYLVKTRSQVTTSDQYSAGAASQKTVTLQVTDPQAREIMGALSSLNSGQKATLLICPSDLTRPPPAESRPSSPSESR